MCDRCMNQKRFSYSPFPRRLSLWNPALLARSSRPLDDDPTAGAEISFRTGVPHLGHAVTGGSDARTSCSKPSRQKSQALFASSAWYSKMGMKPTLSRQTLPRRRRAFKPKLGRGTAVAHIGVMLLVSGTLSVKRVTCVECWSIVRFWKRQGAANPILHYSHTPTYFGVRRIT